MIKVADYIINTLAERGIDKIFVVYGAANFMTRGSRASCSTSRQPCSATRLFSFGPSTAMANAGPDAAIAGRPVARRQVAQHLAQVVLTQPALQFFRRKGVREEILDEVEAGGEEGQVGADAPVVEEVEEAQAALGRHLVACLLPWRGAAGAAVAHPGNHWFTTASKQARASSSVKRAHTIRSATTSAA